MMSPAPVNDERMVANSSSMTFSWLRAFVNKEFNVAILTPELLETAILAILERKLAWLNAGGSIPLAINAVLSAGSVPVGGIDLPNSSKTGVTALPTKSPAAGVAFSARAFIGLRESINSSLVLGGS